MAISGRSALVVAALSLPLLGCAPQEPSFAHLDDLLKDRYGYRLVGHSKPAVNQVHLLVGDARAQTLSEAEREQLAREIAVLSRRIVADTQQDGSIRVSFLTTTRSDLLRLRKRVSFSFPVAHLESSPRH